MAIETIVEIELTGRGQGWTDVSSQVGDSAIGIDYGVKGNGIGDRVASTGTAKFELVNQNPEGKYSFNHTNRLAGWGLGIGVRVRLKTTSAQGTGAGYQIDNGGGYPLGSTVLAVDTGTGSILKDDLVEIAGASGQYIVSSGGNPASSITITPGLSAAVADDAAVSLVGRNFTRHRGRLDSVDPAPGQYERRTVRCTSVDWIDDAARAALSTIPIQQDKRADEIFETLIAAVPFEPVAIEADESPDVFSYALDTARDESSAVLSELQKLALSEFGMIYTKADGTVVFESRNRRALSEGVVDTFEDLDTVSGFAAPVSRDDTISKVQIITHPRKVDTGNTTVLFRLDNPLEVAPTSSRIVFGPYRDPDQEAARVGGTDMIQPVSSTDYLANSQADGGGTNLTSSVDITATFGGNGASVNIENNAAQIAWITLLQLRGRGIYDYQNVVLQAEDAASQIEIGTTVTADLPYQDDAALGQELAIWLLELYKQSEELANTVTVFVPRVDEELAARVLSREISDRIGVVEQITGFDVGVNGGNFIQSVRLGIDARDNLSITWGLAPANRQQFWLLEIPGRTELDQTAVLGFGLVVGHTDVSHCDTHDDTAHADVPHTDTYTDTHTDSAHEDTAHTDSHDDVAHTDTAYIDSHSDVSHEDVSHADSHSDVSHVDAYSDVSHEDTYGDTPYNDFDDHIDGP